MPTRIKTITDYHLIRGLPKPEHPLISLINFANAPVMQNTGQDIVLDFYMISVKRNFEGRMKYGQREYDFDDGTMFFLAPGQVFSIYKSAGIPQGWILLVHPDFLWNTPLAKTIRQHEYFDYAVHEALHLSEKEEATINDLMLHIEQEYRSSIDAYSQNVIIAQLELLLTYAERFYHRQFITRKIANHQVLDRLEKMLTGWFDSDDLVTKGLPSVQQIAADLNVSPNYLSGLLRVLTGQSTQQHIHDKLIEKAKEKLSTTSLSISEIAYELGFEHPQSFTKLFKTKTSLSPLAFRQTIQSPLKG